MVKKSVDNTKWSKLNKRLYLKHENMYDISQWKGSVDNISTKDNNGIIEIRGDVALWDANEAIQILYGDKPVAMSADIEYNDEGIMFFTGFALEADPGVRDHEMFLSEAVKDELNGYYKASFSNIVNANTQSAERGLKEDNQKMENTEQKANEPQKEEPVSGEKPVNEVTENIVKELQSLKGEVQELKKANESKPEPKPEPKPIEQPQKTNSDNKGTVVEDKQLGESNAPKVETQMVDMKTIEKVAETIAEKFKPQEPKAMTVNEFPVDNVPQDEKTVDNIVNYLEKTRNGQTNI